MHLTLCVLFILQRKYLSVQINKVTGAFCILLMSIKIIQQNFKNKKFESRHSECL